MSTTAHLCGDCARNIGLSLALGLYAPAERCDACDQKGEGVEAYAMRHVVGAIALKVAQLAERERRTAAAVARLMKQVRQS